MWYVVLLIGGPLIVALGAWFSYARYRQTWQTRRERLSIRTAMAPGTWFDSYMPGASVHRDELVEVLSALGRQLGVSWTMLLPDDSVASSLSVVPHDPEEFLEFELFLEDWARRHDVVLLDARMPAALSELLQRLDRALTDRSSATA